MWCHLGGVEKQNGRCFIVLRGRFFPGSYVLTSGLGSSYLSPINIGKSFYFWGKNKKALDKVSNFFLALFVLE